MDSDVIFHGNLDFTPKYIFEEKNGTTTVTDGERLILIYVIHKKTLNNAHQITLLIKIRPIIRYYIFF